MVKRRASRLVLHPPYRVGPCGVRLTLSDSTVGLVITLAAKADAQALIDVLRRQLFDGVVSLENIAKDDAGTPFEEAGSESHRTGDGG